MAIATKATDAGVGETFFASADSFVHCTHCWLAQRGGNKFLCIFPLRAIYQHSKHKKLFFPINIYSDSWDHKNPFICKESSQRFALPARADNTNHYFLEITFLRRRLARVRCTPCWAALVLCTIFFHESPSIIKLPPLQAIFFTEFTCVSKCWLHNCWREVYFFFQSFLFAGNESAQRFVLPARRFSKRTTCIMDVFIYWAAVRASRRRVRCKHLLGGF